MIKVIFNEEEHRYSAIEAETGEFLNDLVSVTTLLKKSSLEQLLVKLQRPLPVM